jgi:hypothetical protein
MWWRTADYGDVVFIAAAILGAIGVINLLAIGFCCAAAKRAPLQEEAQYELLAFPGPRNGEIDRLTDLNRAA